MGNGSNVTAREHGLGVTLAMLPSIQGGLRILVSFRLSELVRILVAFVAYIIENGAICRLYCCHCR